jgi:hypothetical protein
MGLAIVTVEMVAISLRVLGATAASCSQDRDNLSCVLRMCTCICIPYVRHSQLRIDIREELWP